MTLDSFYDAGNNGNGKKNILIVDDDADFLLIARRILERPKVAVHIAVSAEDAMALLKEQNYDVVITDVGLTKESRLEGLEILQYAKQRSSDTKVIIMTGYGYPGIRSKANSLGADRFFEKPVSPSVLKETMGCWGIPC